jgi:hypothetical protein
VVPVPISQNKEPGYPGSGSRFWPKTGKSDRVDTPTLVGGPICWKSMIQSTVAMSTIEAEYMAAAEAAKEALWPYKVSQGAGYSARWSFTTL